MISVDTLWSDQLKLDWNYSIYEPENLDRGNMKLVYFLHGAGGNHTDFYSKTSLEKYLDDFNKKSGFSLVAIFVDGFNSYYVDKYMKVESAIFKDLIPGLEKRYSFNIGREDRYLVGLSLGGWGALNYSFRNSDIFSKAFLLSPYLARHMRTDLEIRTWGIFEDDAEYKSHHPLTSFEKNKDTMKPVEIYSYTGMQDKIAEAEDIKYLMDEIRDHVSVKDYYLDGEHEWGLWDRVLEKIFEDREL